MLFVAESPTFCTRDLICPLNISDRGVRVNAKLLVRCGFILEWTCWKTKEKKTKSLYNEMKTKQ